MSGIDSKSVKNPLRHRDVPFKTRSSLLRFHSFIRSNLRSYN